MPTLRQSPREGIPTSPPPPALLELLSAHCATYQLRLRYSTEDVARFGQSDVLRKSVEAAKALNDYYCSIEEKIPAAEAAAKAIPQLSEEQIREAIAQVTSYLKEQRDRYLPSAVPLTPELQAAMWPYFSPALLDSVRIVQLKGERVPNPPFHSEARALGFVNLPDFTHMHSLTFLDVIVFNEPITSRALFHGLVHTVQFQALGVDEYCEHFVRSFANTKFHFTVPLESHAFALESRFSRPAAERFSVEEQDRLCAQQGCYQAGARPAHP